MGSEMCIRDRSETLLVPPRISRHEASAKERPAATLKSGLALSSVAYRSAERESTAIRAQPMKTIRSMRSLSAPTSLLFYYSLRFIFVRYVILSVT